MIISSNTSSAPSAVHSSRRPSRNPGAGSLAVAGSRIRQATWPGCSANSRRTDSRSLNRKLDRQVAHRLRDPRRHRRVADEPVVGGEERLVLADRDQVAAGRRARELDRRGRDVGAVARELDHLPADGLEELLRGGELDRGRPDEVAALVEDGAHGLGHARVRVPQRDRPEPRAVLDVLVAVDVPDVAAAAPRDDRRQALGVLVLALGVRVGASRHEVRQACGELPRPPMAIGDGRIDVVAGHGESVLQGADRRTPDDLGMRN